MSFNEAAKLLPEQRLHELADIFARGLHRALSVRSASIPVNPPDSSPNCLDVCPQTRLHVASQLTQLEKTEGVKA